MTKAKDKPEADAAAPPPTNLAELQARVHVAKEKENKFGGFKFRNAEQILGAAKAVMQGGGHIICTDELITVGGSLFVKARAIVTFGEVSIWAEGLALHALTQKGKDPAMITGSASSYARKYALQGLLAIDDGSQDPDASDKPFEKGDDNEAPPKQVDQIPLTTIRDNLKAAVQGAQNTPEMDGIVKNANFKADFASLAEPMQNEIKAAVKARRTNFENQDVPNNPYEG